jgi:hypothetical protein
MSIFFKSDTFVTFQLIRCSSHFKSWETFLSHHYRIARLDIFRGLGGFFGHYTSYKFAKSIWLLLSQFSNFYNFATYNSSFSQFMSGLLDVWQIAIIDESILTQSKIVLLKETKSEMHRIITKIMFSMTMHILKEKSSFIFCSQVTILNVTIIVFSCNKHLEKI